MKKLIALSLVAMILGTAVVGCGGTSNTAKDKDKDKAAEKDKDAKPK